MINYNDKNELLANREKIEKIEFLDIKKVKEDYISYWKSVTSIPQEKIQKMLDWLETTDFYSAPASISNKNHGSFTGGLVLHHLLVLKVFEAVFGYIDDNVIICILGHDFAKIGSAERALKPVLDEKTQKWKTEERYNFIDDGFAYGHGEKAVDILRDFFDLTQEQKLVIRWHMGAYEGEPSWNYLKQAESKYPLVMMVHFADNWCATYLA